MCYNFHVYVYTGTEEYESIEHLFGTTYYVWYEYVYYYCSLEEYDKFENAVYYSLN